MFKWPTIEINYTTCYENHFFLGFTFIHTYKTMPKYEKGKHLCKIGVQECKGSQQYKQICIGHKSIQNAKDLKICTS